VILRRQEARRLAALTLLVAGCTGGTSEPAVNQAVPQRVQTTSPVPATPASTPIATAAPIAESATVIEARAAFRVLIEPGSEPAAWETAQQKLIGWGAEAAPVLLEGIRSSNPLEREMAATVCALTGSPSADLQAALVNCLQDDALFVRANAAVALTNIPEHQAQALSTLTNLLTESDPQLRRMAATNLSSFGTEASEQLPKLTAVLAADDTEVVMPVIQLLGRMGPTAIAAVPELQRIAFEESGEVKQAAEQALLQIQAQ
jgi:HEAT repeat protein